MRPSPLKIALLHFNLCSDVYGLVQEHVRLLRQNGHTVILGCLPEMAKGTADAFIPLSLNSSLSDYTTYLGSALSGTDCVWFYGDPFAPLGLALDEALERLPSQLPSARWIYWAVCLPCHLPRGVEVRARFLKGRDWECVADEESLASVLRDQCGVSCRTIFRGVDPAVHLKISTRLASLAEKEGWWDANLVLFYPACILSEDDFIEILSALRGLSGDGFDLKFIAPLGSALNGAGAGRARCADLARDFDLQGQVWLGAGPSPLSVEERTSFLQICDALVLSSAVEAEAGFSGSVSGIVRPAFKLGCRKGVNKVKASVNGLIDDSKETVFGSTEGLIRQLVQCETIQARRIILRNNRWQSIYDNLIENLLLQPPMLNVQ